MLHFVTLGGWVLAVVLFLLSFQKVITPLWIAKVFESEGVPSTRLILAFVLTLITVGIELYILYLGQTSNELALDIIKTNMTAVDGMLVFGVLKVAASRFAPKPDVDPAEREASELDSNEGKKA